MSEDLAIPAPAEPVPTFPDAPAEPSFDLPPAPRPPSAAPVSLAPDPLDLLYLELSAKLAPALNAFVGAPLAKFAWKSRAAAGTTGSLTISLTRVSKSQRANAAQITLELACVAASGESVPISIVLNPVRQTEAKTLSYRLKVGSNFRSWECAAVDAGDLVSQGAFPKPPGLAALEHLNAVWFGASKDAARAGVAAGVERVEDACKHPGLAPFWPVLQMSKKRDCGLSRAPQLDAGPILIPRAEEWAAGLLIFCIWSLLVRSVSERGGDESIPFDALAAASARGLPPAELYWPRRSVDLTAPQVQAALQREGLVIPWHVIEAACAALSAGKHVIFTGPPGCGKSKLSGVLAALATGQEPLMVTASPAWTSGDLVGRYFPRRDGNGLEFKPGFFLKAIDEGNRWLVIDEFNRAHIDECFGELFSVLADDIVELPFEEEIEGKGGDGAPAVFGAVRILPARRSVRSNEGSATHAETVDYAVGPAFRLIGTMNDADRSALHQLSFALLRRFHIIRVEAPAAPDVERIMTGAMKRAAEDLMLESVAYKVTRKSKRSTALELDMALPRLRELFARDLSKRKERSYTDLVQERVVGLATVQDIIRFVAEGIRGPAQGGRDASAVSTDHLGEEVKLEEHAQATCASFLAIAVVLSVFPQLDALTIDARRAAVKHIISVFQPKGEPPILMRRIEASPEADGGLRLALIDHLEPSEFDLDADKYVSIAEFLVEELSQQYRGTEEVGEFRALLAEAIAKTG